jgi:UDP-N-acetylmuramate--alanine ligase
MNNIRRVHMMGIGGSGMSGVALLASKMGYEVTGCDLEGRTAYAEKIFKGHDLKHLEGVDLLVVSPAVYYQNKNTPELVEGEKRKIVMSWQEFLGKILLKDKKVIAVAGTHGKSTVTAMAGKLLADAGLDPIVVLGAYVPEWGGNSRYGKGKWAVVEADEFNNNFLNYHPEILIITNIEFDHPDFFRNEAEVKKSFEMLKKNMVGRRVLITEKDDEHIHFNLKILGQHNQRNANMVWALGEELNICTDTMFGTIENFKGIGRRLELISDKKGIKVYDDYAHHPTAIKATIEAVREKYPKARIIAVDEAHGFARTHALLNLYKGAFDAADKVFVGPVFKARDAETFGMTPQIIAEKSGHADAAGYDSFGKIKNVLSKEIRQGDIILVMGAGKSYLWAREIAGLKK